MRKLIKAALLLVILTGLHAKAFAFSANCHFTNKPVSGVDTIQITDEALTINGDLDIPLEKTSIRCGSNGTRERFEGTEKGFQVILKTCSVDNKLEGHLIDSVKQEIADIACD